MRGKVAKALRKAAYGIPEIPDEVWKETEYKRTKLVLIDGVPSIREEVHVTEQLAPHCRRAWYKSMKKGHNYVK